ncbi:MAG: hypothetical protein KDE14_15605 [Rhodobacteraceae bacterium]|nr:hypothetical protein [Paracoccaceae bacterium]
MRDFPNTDCTYDFRWRLLSSHEHSGSESLFNYLLRAADFVALVFLDAIAFDRGPAFAHHVEGVCCVLPDNSPPWLGCLSHASFPERHMTNESQSVIA